MSRCSSAALVLVATIIAGAGCQATAPTDRTPLPVVAPPPAPSVMTSPVGGETRRPGTAPPSRNELLRPQGRTERAELVRVVDGDTIRVTIDGTEHRVRYIGIDTPETVRPGSPVEEFAIEASDANRELLVGRRLVLERDVSETDRFGRLLRYIWTVADADRYTFVNLELVRRGYAQVATYPPDVRYVDLFLEAQREAREAERGLWSAD